MSGTSPCFEVRLYGLQPSVSNSSLLTFFSSGVTVLGTRMHPPNSDQHPQNPHIEPQKAWAQIWTASEAEVHTCMELKEQMERKGITIMRAPCPTEAPAWQVSSIQTPSPALTAPPPPFAIDSLRYNHGRPFASTPDPIRDPVSLARNLYILGIPIDMTQHQFKSLFVPHGMVEHSTLLSQLDGAGRRRGFVLMSTHQEAMNAMEAMNGRVIDGYRMDISWALVQREAKYFQTMGALPNRVVHPPTVPSRRVPLPGCTVLVENLNPLFFPNAGAVRDLFSFFGPVLRVTVIPGEPMTALLAFEHKVCADALVKANGMWLNGQTISTRYLSGPTGGAMEWGGEGDGMTELESAMTSRFSGREVESQGTRLDLGPLPLAHSDRPLLHKEASPVPPANFHSARTPFLPQYPFRPSSPPIPSRYSTDSLNLDALLSLESDASAQAANGIDKGSQASKTNKLNPESQEFVPGDGSQDVNSSPSKGSSGTRVGSVSAHSAGSMQGSMKGWEAAKRLWD